MLEKTVTASKKNKGVGTEPWVYVEKSLVCQECGCRVYDDALQNMHMSKSPSDTKFLRDLSDSETESLHSTSARSAPSMSDDSVGGSIGGSVSDRSDVEEDIGRAIRETFKIESDIDGTIRSHNSEPILSHRSRPRGRTTGRSITSRFLSRRFPPRQHRQTRRPRQIRHTQPTRNQHGRSISKSSPRKQLRDIVKSIR